MRVLEFQHLCGPDGWRSPGFVSVDEHGCITEVSDQPPHEAAERFEGFAIPGMPNLHSHAFQRAMAGRTERRSSVHASDSFWTWRETMYDFAQRIGPDELEAVAAWLYAEMLRTGMTSVGEFQYLHHAPDGAPYDDRAELARRIVAAARAAGIGLTMLPVLYMQGGFDRPIEERQRRFAHADVGEFLSLVAEVGRDARTGIALHSLRAVGPEQLREAVAGCPEGAPIHIHIAEQVREVEECVAHLGARPVRWLLDNAGVDGRWCLVHATHCDEGERDALASSGAVAGLCPTTEANLGDGIFPLPEFLAAGGAFGVGTDSHVSVGAAEELRLLEYGQRLTRLERNVAARSEHTGAALYDAAVAGGARALGLGGGAVVPGNRADIVVLDAADPRLVGHGTDTVLDAYVFSTAASNVVRDVLVGGEVVVRGGRHVREDELLRGFVRAMEKLDG